MATCTIQALNWLRNGTSYIPGCTGTTADNIEAELMVSISLSSGESGLNAYCLFTVDTPTGAFPMYANKGNVITFIGSGNFSVILKSTDGFRASTAGNYTLYAGGLENVQNRAWICVSGSSTPRNCTTIGITSTTPSCTLQQGYFTKGGVPISGATCIAAATDAISVECVAAFSPVAVGNQYKAELKVRVPTGVEISFFTPLIAVSASQKFTVNFTTPIITGTYTAVWFVIYDSAGSTICVSDGASTSYCRTLNISSACTNPKFKCSGTTCISDNCDGTGTYTTNNCNNACSPGCTNPKYKCSPSGTCISDNCDGTGTYTTNYCNNACTTGGGTGCKTNADCSSTQMCLLGSCYEKNQLYMLGLLAVVILMTNK